MNMHLPETSFSSKNVFDFVFLGENRAIVSHFRETHEPKSYNPMVGYHSKF